MSKVVGAGSFGTYSFLSNTNDVKDLLYNNTLDGDWSLIVIDYYNNDVGKLNNWSITFDY